MKYKVTIKIVNGVLTIIKRKKIGKWNGTGATFNKTKKK